MAIDFAEPEQELDDAPFDGGTRVVVDGTDVVGPAAAGREVKPLEPLDKLKAALANFRTKYETYKPDLSTKEGEAIARANRKELVTLRTSTDKAYEQINGPLLAIQRDARALKKLITDEVTKYETPIDEAIKAVEAEREAEKKRKEEAERQRLLAIRQRMSDIAAIPVAHVRSTSAEVEAAIEALGAQEISEADFGDFAEDAQGVRQRALEELKGLSDAAFAREQAEMRAAEERAAEDQRRRDEAARLAAERAELDRQRAELAAAQAAAAEEARAVKLKAEEDARIEAAKAAAARQKEADAAAARNAEAQRQADAQALLLKQQTDAFHEERLEANRLLEEERKALKAERDALLAAQAPTEDESTMPASARSEAAIDQVIAAGGQELVDRVANGIVDATNALQQGYSPALSLDCVLEASGIDFMSSAPCPPDSEIIALIADTYDVPAAVAIDWLESIDLFAARATLEQAA